MARKRAVTARKANSKTKAKVPDGYVGMEMVSVPRIFIMHAREQLTRRPEFVDINLVGELVTEFAKILQTMQSTRTETQKPEAQPS